MTEVSRNRPPTNDHRRKPRTVTVGLALISYEAGNAAACSCGTTFYHQRAKVVEDKIDKHIDKRHHGRGIRL